MQRTDAAQTVRCEFCRDLLAAKAKTTQQKMTAWAVDQILARDRAVTGWLNDHSISSAPPLADILGSETPMDVVAAATPPTLRALMVWAYVVAAHEFDYSRDAHRSPSVCRAAYVRHLVDLGCTPAEADRLVLGEQYLDAATELCRSGARARSGPLTGPVRSGPALPDHPPTPARHHTRQHEGVPSAGRHRGLRFTARSVVTFLFV